MQGTFPPTPLLWQNLLGTLSPSAVSFLLIILLLVMAILKHKRPAHDAANRRRSEEEQPFGDIDCIFSWKASGRKTQSMSISKEIHNMRRPYRQRFLSNWQMQGFDIVIMGIPLACMLCLLIPLLLCIASPPTVVIGRPMFKWTLEERQHDALTSFVSSVWNHYLSGGVAELRKTTDRPSTSAQSLRTTQVTQYLPSCEPCEKTTFHDIYMFTRTDIYTKNGLPATSISTNSWASTRSSSGWASTTTDTTRFASGKTIIYTTIITYTETRTVIPATTPLRDAGDSSMACQPSVARDYSQGPISSYTTMGTCLLTPKSLQKMESCNDGDLFVSGPWHFEILCSDTSNGLSVGSSSLKEDSGFLKCISHCVEANVDFGHSTCRGVKYHLRGLTDEPWCFLLSLTEVFSIIPIGGTRATGSLMEWTIGARLVRWP